MYFLIVKKIKIKKLKKPLGVDGFDGSDKCRTTFYIMYSDGDDDILF